MRVFIEVILVFALTSIFLKVLGITIDQFPYQASLHNKTNFVCSGALISPKWVLTSASCFVPNPKMIRVGSSNFTAGGHTSIIDAIHIHPNYNPKILFANDIAVVSLQQNILFDSRVKAIKMADHELQIGAQLYAIGWGPHANSPKYSNVLLSALKSIIVDRNQCSIRVNQLSKHLISDDIICTGGNGRGFCNENPGSVLATKDGILYGIATWTQLCGKTLNYDLFVSVAFHRDFIYQITGK